MFLHLRPAPAVVRCAICHDDAVDPLDRCRGCGTRAHTDCWEALDACATLGCVGRFERRPRRGAAWLSGFSSLFVTLLASLPLGPVVHRREGSGLGFWEPPQVTLVDS